MSRVSHPAITLRGQILRSLGEVTHAEENLAHAEKLDPEWFGAWSAVQDAQAQGDWVQLGDAIGGLFEFEKRRGESYRGVLGDLLLQRGIARFEAGLTEAAIRDLAAARWSWPDAIAPVLLIGQAYARDDDVANADQWFEEWHASWDGEVPFAEWTYLTIGQVFADLVAQPAQTQAMLKWKRRAADAGPTGEATLIRHLCLCRPKEALSRARQARTRRPHNFLIEAAYYLALGVNGYTEDASVGLDEVLRRAGDSEFLWAIAMFLSMELGRPAALEIVSRRQIEMGCWGSYLNLSWALQLQGRVEESIIMLERRLEEAPTDVIARLNLPNQYGIVGRFDEARQVSERLIEADLSILQPDGYDVRSRVLSRLGDLRLAEQVLRDGVGRYPGSSPAHRSLAEFLMRRDRWSEAQRHLLLCVSDRTESGRRGQDLRWALDRLALVLGCDPLDLSEDSARTLEKFLDDANAPVESADAFWCTLALARAKLGRHDEAAAALAQAEALPPSPIRSRLVATRSALAALRGDVLAAVTELERTRRPMRTRFARRLEELRALLRSLASLRTPPPTWQSFWASRTIGARRDRARQLEGRREPKTKRPLASYVRGKLSLREDRYEDAVVAFEAARLGRPRERRDRLSRSPRRSRSPDAPTMESSRCGLESRRRQKLLRMTHLRTRRLARRWNAWASFAFRELDRSRRGAARRALPDELTR